MRRVLAVTCAIGSVGGAAACWAQTDEDDVKALVSDFVEAIEAGDKDAMADLLCEAFIAAVQGDCQDREAFLAETATEREPVAVGDYTPEVYGDAAIAVLPVELRNFAEGGAPIKIRVALLCLRTADDWKALALGLMLSDDLLQPMPEEERQQIRAAATSFDAFPDTVLNALLAGETFGAILDLCAPDAVFAGPYGPDGAMIVTTAKELRETGELPAEKVTVAADPQDAVESGLLAGVMAINASVTSDGETQLRREIAIAAYSMQDQVWQIIAAVSAPLE